MNRVIKYDEIQKNKTLNSLLDLEINEQCFISCPLPTLCFGEPAYVQFSAPVSFHKENLCHEPPSYWWGISAITGKLLFFDSYQMRPFSLTQKWQSFLIPASEVVKTDLSQKYQNFEKYFDIISPFFFQKEDECDSIKKNFLFSYEQCVTNKNLSFIYQELAPDFFKWLSQ